MRSIHLLSAALALTLLAACDKEAPPAPKAPPAPPPITSIPEPAPPAAPAPEAKPAPPPPPAQAPKPLPSPPVPEKPKEPPVAAVKAPLPKTRLDLSLPRELVDQLQPSGAPTDQPDQPLLPKMFVQKPAPNSPFQLNGKLITNEREDDYWRSVEGAELQFEFKR